MSESGHAPPLAFLFDHLVGAQEDRGWHFQAKRLRRLQIDGDIEFRRLQERKVGRLGALVNPSGIDAQGAEVRLTRFSD